MHNVITSCAKTLYALKIESSACTRDEWALQSVYRALVISKLMYGSSVCWGFASHNDRQRTQAFICRSERSRFTPPKLTSFADLSREADDTLFDRILNNSHRVLRHLLPPLSQASQHYAVSKNVQNCFVRTSSNFHSFWYFLAERWQRAENYAGALIFHLTQFYSPHYHANVGVTQHCNY